MSKTMEHQKWIQSYIDSMNSLPPLLLMAILNNQIRIEFELLKLESQKRSFFEVSIWNTMKMQQQLAREREGEKDTT